MTFLHLESWLIRETGVVWRARAEQCLAQCLVSPSVFLKFGVWAVWHGNDEAG